MTNVLYVFEKYYRIEKCLGVFQETSEKMSLTRGEKSQNKEEEMLPAATIPRNCSAEKYVQSLV